MLIQFYCVLSVIRANRAKNYRSFKIRIGLLLDLHVLNAKFSRRENDRAQNMYNRNDKTTKINMKTRKRKSVDVDNNIMIIV